jgi:glycosyltransferase involved in cell wall biosynthesis
MRVLAAFPSRDEDWIIVNSLVGTTELSILVDRTATPALTSSRGYRLKRLDSAGLTVSFSHELRTVSPDFLLWFEDLQSVRSWHCWNLLRHISPDSLVSLVITKPLRRRILASRLLRLCLTFRVIDHVILGQANSKIPPNPTVQSNRIESVHWTGAYGTVDLLQRRFCQEQKSVLWVDPFVTKRCPSMAGLIEIVPRLAAQGWNIRALCYEVQMTVPPVEAIRLPKLPGPSFLQPLQFFIACNIYRFIQSAVLHKQPARITHATCPSDLRADICSIHFCHERWIQIARSSRSPWFRDWAALQVSRMLAILDRWQVRSRSVSLLLPVSRAIGDVVRQCYRTHTAQRVLPNAFDETRFNPATRQLHRASTRQALGFSETESVFAFSSYGHYRRKGFWLIVKALQILAERGERNVRLLVIGGTLRTLKRLKSELATSFPEYTDWIAFVGTTSQVEKYLSAADAFLFPSYFEAFCLAEIEAAAIGLPLLVTRHPGTEMIMRDGKNGVWLEFDPRDIANKIQAFVRGEFDFDLPNAGEALTKSQYADTVVSIYNEFLSQKLARNKLIASVSS